MNVPRGTAYRRGEGGMSPVPWLCFLSYSGSLTVTQFRQRGLVYLNRASPICCCRCCLQWSMVSSVRMEWFTVVQSCTKRCQATPSMWLARLTRGNTELTQRGEMFQWFNPFPRVVFAGLTPTELYYRANQVDGVFYSFYGLGNLCAMVVVMQWLCKSGIFVLEASVVHWL